MNVQDLVNVSIGLSATPASQAKFTVPLLLVDHADVPLDKKYRIVTRSSYATDLTASTDQANWCAALWGQNYNPAEAYIGRWIKTASAAYCVCPNATTVASVYAALTNTAKFKLTEGASTEDISPDFTGDTTMAEVCASIQAALALSTLGAAYTCALDSYDRVTITSDNTGTSADAVSIASPDSGTDLTGSAYLGSSFAQGGLDAESLGAAASRIFAVDNTPFICCERGGSTAQQVAFSTAINALDKILLLVVNDENGKDSGDTTDAGYQIEALSHQKTHLTYTEHNTDNGAAADQHPDAAIIGEVLQVAEGSRSFALTALSGVSESGLGADNTTVVPLTATERSALDDKGYDYLITPSTVTHLRHGLAAGGNEMRIMIAKSYMAAKCSEEIYAYMIANDVVTFSDSDIQAIKGIISKWADVLADRKVLDPNTYVWNMPSASDFTAATKATHTMTLSNVFSATVLSSVNDITLTMSFTV